MRRISGPVVALGGLCLVLSCAAETALPEGDATEATASAPLERAEPTSEEARFIELLNDERTARGLTPLASYWDLVDDARRHAGRMIAAGRIYHSEDLSEFVRAEIWLRLGENVGHGGSPETLHDAFMRSDAHRANILGDYDYVGIGARRDSGGHLWVTVAFMKSDHVGLERTLPPFEDDDGSPHERDIYAVYAAGITRGCSADGRRYCPTRPVTRAQMAAFLVRALELPPSSRDRFVDDDGHWGERDIQALAAADITRGCSRDGTRFCPEDVVTRAQMAAFLVRAFSLPRSDDDRFVDDDGHWAEGDIQAFAASGITRGCSRDGTRFCPEDAVTRAQMASFLARALEL